MARSILPLDSELLKDALSKERWWSRIVFWTAAGTLGLIAVFFARLCDWAAHSFLAIHRYNPYLPFLICPLGFWIIYRLQFFMFPGSEGSGIPQVMAALKSRSPGLRDKLLSFRVLVGKIVCTFLGLLSGASIGREGPSVHIGAALFNFLGHFARFSRFERRQGLVIAGAAAGIAAAFNAPLAGIVFAIEELKGSFEERSSGLMLSAVILSGLMSLALLGHYTHFKETSIGIAGIGSVWPVFLISVMGGLFGGLFSKVILIGTPKIKNWRPFQPWIRPLLLGFFIASIGYFSNGQSYGSGHDATQVLIESSDGSTLLFPFFKWAATVLSYLSGVAGGVFSPSLSVGAGLGGLVAPLFTDIPREALLLLGMVSYLSGVIRAPVTAFVIVFEMTSNHVLLIPLMAASFVAVGASKLVCRTPLYKGLAEVYFTKH